MNGVVVVDKPTGVTSHDVVQRVRKTIGQRSVGHAGTLDPLATGVLVVAVGEGTKLVSYLQAHDKRYDVTIALGIETDSLDADGQVTATAAVPDLGPKTVSGALESFLGTHGQRAPAMSAVKVQGTPLHRRTRRGEAVELPVRNVTLHSALVKQVSREELRLDLHCGKGFYVRALARDLTRKLGTVGHVSALRRTASGPFMLDDAVEGDSLSRGAIEARLLTLAEACGGLIRVELDDAGVDHARHGRRIDRENTLAETWPDETGPGLALFGSDGVPVAIGTREGDQIRVVRGFVSSR
ncbi:MAG: tRNA pseudouridine(55) synthase TruB [Myxococcota bacterium]